MFIIVLFILGFIAFLTVLKLIYIFTINKK